LQCSSQRLTGHYQGAIIEVALTDFEERHEAVKLTRQLNLHQNSFDDAADVAVKEAMDKIKSLVKVKKSGGGRSFSPAEISLFKPLAECLSRKLFAWGRREDSKELSFDRAFLGF
jgi:hypothetical protein